MEKWGGIGKIILKSGNTGENAGGRENKIYVVDQTHMGIVHSRLNLLLLKRLVVFVAEAITFLLKRLQCL
jgi:hypothetical protein